jgi:hypothetical protein
MGGIGGYRSRGESIDLAALTLTNVPIKTEDEEVLFGQAG